MEIIRELDQSEREALREKHSQHFRFETHIAPVLSRPRCFRVNLFARDFDEILVGSRLPGAHDRQLHPYQSISRVIDYVQRHHDFLRTSVLGCLNGTRVQHYLERLGSCPSRLPDCFANMGDCFMLEESGIGNRYHGQIRIRDGMHRLVAYGLATGLKEDQFPIPIYFGTDKAL
jgi:hypothetical protein